MLTICEFKSLYEEINGEFWFDKNEKNTLAECLLKYTDLSSEDEKILEELDIKISKKKEIEL
jgi:hypothetical protein